MATINISHSSFTVLVKPNAAENKILGFDAKRQAYRISVKAPAEDNKANKELIRFLSKELGRQVRIVRGLTERKKIIRIT